MSAGVVFVSGWAGYPALMPRVAEIARFITPFAGEDCGEDAVLRAMLEGGDVLAAWSTGAHMALKHRAEVFPRYGRVLLFAPFLDFCAHVDPEVLRTMRRTLLAEGPVRTVRAFWRNCGLRGVDFEPPLGHGVTLAAGLDYLLGSRVRLSPDEDGSRVRILHGAGDRVVPVAIGGEIASLLAGAWRSIMDFGHCPPEGLILDVLHEETGSHAFQQGR